MQDQTRKLVGAGLAMLVILAILTVVGSWTPSRQVAAAAGGPDVTIQGPLPLPVRPVADSIEPVALQFACNAVGTRTCDATAQYTVPTGKQLVIEYFSVLAHLPAGESAAVLLNGAAEFLPLLPPAAGSDNPITSGGQAVRQYVGPGGVVIAGAIRTESAGIGGFQFYVAGRLMNAAP